MASDKFEVVSAEFWTTRPSLRGFEQVQGGSDHPTRRNILICGRQLIPPLSWPMRRQVRPKRSACGGVRPKFGHVHVACPRCAQSEAPWERARPMRLTGQVGGGDERIWRVIAGTPKVTKQLSGHMCRKVTSRKPGELRCCTKVAEDLCNSCRKRCPGSRVGQFRPHRGPTRPNVRQMLTKCGRIGSTVNRC